jgi:hypothetical protein
MLHRMLVVLFLAGTTAGLFAQSNVSFETYSASQKTDWNSGFRPGLVTGDFNNDGKPDLVECCNSSEQIMFLAGNGDGTFRAPVVAYATPIDAPDLVAADVNGDGKLDLVGIAAMNPPPAPGEGLYELTVWLGNGDGTFQPAQTYTTMNQPAQVVTGNFFNDGRPDLAVAEGSSVIELFRNEGNGNFNFDKSINMGGGYYAEMSIAAGDFNGNGITDLAVAQLASTSNGINFANPQQLYAVWNDGKGNFTQQQVGTGYYDPQLAVSRLNGTEMMDLLVSYRCTPAYGANYCVGFDAYYGQGNDKLFKRTVVTDSSGTNAGDLGQIFGVDVNGDGYGDIVAVGAEKCNTSDGTCNNPPQGLFVWLGNADGSFQQTEQTFYSSTFGNTGPAAVADFTRNGMMDFAEPNVSYSTLQVYLNATQRTTCGKYTINPTVTECQPVDGTYSPSPVQVQATSYDTTRVTAMQEYVDYQLVYSQPVTSMDRTFAEPVGAHYFVTKAWDASGRSFRADRTVTVYNGTPGAVCPVATDSASICVPSGDTASSPVLILANGDTGKSVPTAAQLYIDGNLVVNNNSGGTSYVETRQNLSAGTHNLVFKVWAMNGNVYKAQKTITVN